MYRLLVRPARQRCTARRHWSRCGQSGHTALRSDQIRRAIENACEKGERAGGLSPGTDGRPGAEGIGDSTIAAAVSSRGVPVRLGARCCASMTKGAVAIGVAHGSEAGLMTRAVAGPSCWQRPSDDAGMEIAAHDPTHARAVGAPLSMNAIAKVMARDTNALPRKLGGQARCQSHRLRGLEMGRLSRI